jgi:transcriptional regulator with XRE-family HTH domain
MTDGRMRARVKGTVALDPTAIGQRVRARRQELNLSQRVVTNGLSGVTYAYVSRIEAGQRLPSLAALAELAHALQTTALWLAFGERPPEKCPTCGQPTSDLEPHLPAERIEAAREGDGAS